MKFIPEVFAKTITTGLEDTDVPTFASLADLFTNLVSAIASFAGIVLFIMLVTGGFTFLFSGGDPKKMEKAKGTITGAIIGIIVMVCGYVILRIIEGATGVPVTKFNLDIQPN